MDVDIGENHPPPFLPLLSSTPLLLLLLLLLIIGGIIDISSRLSTASLGIEYLTSLLP